CARWQSVFDFW
nr:immunoglobulin heavy chain junction region [Macaca mulatta]MOY22000.1 immunoglobulin heavy chain junction region [Macaca mulatta]MOY22527.1 immunoglobulin heavy chain junction region [Macaca mulatta]MOY23174.1 immunoglobulin heavy chain junction region [Macaca mulatta]MOY23688.1 immunoglobulin heavy chain junction region [Macaca mulatta]